MPLAIQADDVRAAALRIRPLALRTPVLTSTAFDAKAGVHVFFKCENLQRGGAFKIRGASNLILSLAPETLARGIVAYSSGNHAQAVAIAALHVGAQAHIVMPEDAPRSKMEATRSHGPRIVTYNRLTGNRESIAAAILKETGGVLVPPFDHPLIMAGQGTAALELFDETGPLDALITPVGGGGLLSGCATIARAMNPAIRVFGAEPAGANDTFLSLQAGERVAVPHPDTIRNTRRAQAVGDSIGVGHGDALASLEREEGVVGAGGFGAENPDGGVHGAGDCGTAGEQSAAAHRGDKGVQRAGIVEQFQGGGALAGHDQRVVEGWHQNAAGFLQDGGGDGLAVLGESVVGDDVRPM